MAKSKSRVSTTSLEKSSSNQIVQQWQAVRSELRKVTWPTREEARKLTIAVAIGMVVMAIFLYLVDALFQQVIIVGILELNIIWIIVSIIIVTLLGFAFYSNNRDA